MFAFSRLGLRLFGLAVRACVVAGALFSRRLILLFLRRYLLFVTVCYRWLGCCPFALCFFEFSLFFHLFGCLPPLFAFVFRLVRSSTLLLFRIFSVCVLLYLPSGRFPGRGGRGGLNLFLRRTVLVGANAPKEGKFRGRKERRTSTLALSLGREKMFEISVSPFVSSLFHFLSFTFTGRPCSLCLLCLCVE